MSALGFVSRHLGEYVTAPGGVGRQCVDLANLYLLEEFKEPHVFLNAKDWAHATLPGWSWANNSPTNVPPVGALVVWGPFPKLGIGQYGHIALVLAADVNHVLSMDQDWPFGAACLLVLHSYGGVLGWWSRTGAGAPS